ncbi:MAG: hypothetical protein H0U76_12150 [Ktedonobacteraceae bacterium]|nr:hypothetical protein [Ktedonobacteraceae bacterium]
MLMPLRWAKRLIPVQREAVPAGSASQIVAVVPGTTLRAICLSPYVF